MADESPNGPSWCQTSFSTSSKSAGRDLELGVLGAEAPGRPCGRSGSRRSGDRRRSRWRRCAPGRCAGPSARPRWSSRGRPTGTRPPARRPPGACARPRPAAAGCARPPRPRWAAAAGGAAKLTLPVAADLAAPCPATSTRRCAGGSCVHAPVQAARRRRVAVGQQAGHARRVDLGGHPGGEQRLDLRGEQEAPGVPAVEQRLLAGAVAGQQQAPLRGCPRRRRRTCRPAARPRRRPTPRSRGR